MKLAILIDFHNLFSMLAKDAEKTKAAIAEIVKMGRRRGEILETRLFVPIYFIDEEREKLWRLINAISLRFGIEVEGCAVSSISTDAGKKMKDSVDNGVMMYVVRNVHKDIGPELIIFVTGDGDFVKFSTIAQNKGKKTEFWSVDPSNTNYFIKKEVNFHEIEASSLQENLFLVALNKKTNNQVLDEAESARLRIVVQMANLALPSCEMGEMSILISGRLGISHADSDRLLEMLTTLGIAEVTISAKKVVTIDYPHHLFGYLSSSIEPETPQKKSRRLRLP